MNVCKYYPLDVINGAGTRCSLFVSGCEHQCRGCYNKSTWKLDSGVPFTEQMENDIIRDLQDTVIIRRGITLSGGDPLHPANCTSVLRLLKRIKNECPDKDVWLWSGYVLCDVNDIQKEILDLVDVFIDGPFVEEQKDPSLIWRGSSNQVVYDFSETDRLIYRG